MQKKKSSHRKIAIVVFAITVWVPLHVEPIKDDRNKRLSSEEPMATVESVTIEEYLRRRLPKTSTPKQVTTLPTTTTKAPAKSSERAKLGFRYWYLDPLLKKRNPGI